jgi:protein ImuB
MPPQLIGKRGLEREHRVHRAWGPERIETGWWRKGLICRDYFRVETTEGRRFWLFRHAGGQWYLHGFFD